MKSIEAYKRCLLKANKNDTNEGVNIPISHFVLMFNEQSRVWMYQKLLQKGDSFNINDLEAFLKVDIDAPVVEKNERFIEALLPDDLLRYRASHSLCDKGNCIGVRVYNYDKNVANMNPILQDISSGPNFEYEETPCILSDGKLIIFTDDFEIQKVLVTYYRQPADIDIEGYTRFDGTPSQNVDPEFPDVSVNEIVNLVVLEIERETRDVEGFQLSQNRKDTED